MHIALLHTGEIHVATFDALLDQLGHDGRRTHVVREDLLTRARAEGVEAIRDEAAAVMRDMADADSLLCTCSTLGPITDQVAEGADNVLRIDRPLMEKACAIGPNILVVMCLESTRGPTLDLLSTVSQEARVAIAPRTLLCAEAWPLFEAGEVDAFGARIAEAIRAEIAKGAPTDCIVLAQASMRAAEPHLKEIGPPVLSSPSLAVARALEIAAGR